MNYPADVVLYVPLVTMTLLLFALELFLPEMQAPDMLLGARVTTEFKKGRGRRIVAKYRASLILITVVSYALLALSSLPAAILMPFVFMTLSSINYMCWRRVVIRERGELPAAARRYAVISTSPHGRAVYIPAALAWAFLISIIVAGAAMYSRVPSELLYHISASGSIEYVPKTPVHYYLMDIIALVPFSLITAIIAIAGRTPNIVNPAYPEQSYLAYTRFRDSIVIFSGVILFIIAALMGSLSLVVWEVLSTAYMPLLVVSFVLAIALLTAVLYFSVGVEGAAYLKGIEVNGEVLDDDRYWKGGMFYYNPNDPRIFVPKRSGLGYTVNFGNREAVLVLIGIIAAVPIAVILIVLLAA